MGKSVRVKLEVVDDESGEVLESKEVQQHRLVKPKSIADLGLSHQAQMDLLQSIQDKIVDGEADFLK